MRRSLRSPVLLALVLTASFLVPSGAEPSGPTARVFDVRPGELRQAIERAGDGDTLLIHQGRYRGPFVISERLRLIGAPGERRPVIDGRCATNLTLAVRHRGVVLRHLEVIGADEGHGSFPREVDFTDVASGRAVDLFVRDTCDAEYGINVFHSREIEILDSVGRGFSDAAFYVGGVTSTGSGVLRVTGNEGFSNSRGIIVEDSAGGRIRIVDNFVHDNKLPFGDEGPPAGIFLHNADGLLLRANRMIDNGAYGVHLDPNSANNRLFDNRARGNPRGAFFDEGAGNCGSGNRPNPFPPC